MNKLLFKNLLLLLLSFGYLNNLSAKTNSISVFFTELINGLNVTYVAAVNSTSPVEYFWDYGDGNTNGWISNNQVQHTYSSPGVYLVKLIARNTENETDSLIRAITITESPIANFNYYPDTIYYGQSVQFTDMSVSLAAPITNWVWDFGFGFENSQQNPTRSFSQGTWQVKLQITNSNGQTSSITKQLIVRSALTNDFSFSPDTIRAGTPVQFTGLAYTVSGTLTSNRYWQFDDWQSSDNGYSYEANPIHVFTVPGMYDVWHVVSNSYGEMDTIIKPVQVLDAVSSAVMDFSYSPAGIYPWEPVQFTDMSVPVSGTSVNWLWDLGDGATFNGATISHYYILPGKYDVRLILGNSSGNLDTLVKRITVALRPEQKDMCIGGNVTLHATQVSSSYRWQQSFDGGASYYPISDGSSFSGAATQNLTISNVLSSMRGRKYRCLLTSGYSNPEFTIAFKNEYSGTGVWGSFLNWSCGSPPDENTDVIITSGTVTVNSNVACRSLTVLPGANIIISPGYNLDVRH